MGNRPPLDVEGLDEKHQRDGDDSDDEKNLLGDGLKGRLLIGYGS